MLQILGRNNSSNVQKVLWLCAELGIDFERHDYGGPFANTTDDTYLALNPNARVPTIIDQHADQQLVLWESNAILRYLCHKHVLGSGDCPIYPTALPARAAIEQWLDWQQTTVSPAITPVFWGLIRTPEKDRDKSAIESGHSQMQACVHILESTLTDHDYVAGDEFSIADIPLGIMIYRWHEMPIQRDATPAVERWYQRLTNREPFRQAVMIGLT